jgi:hypothetical protein
MLTLASPTAKAACPAAMSPVHSQYLGVSLDDGRSVSDDSVGLRCDCEQLPDVVMWGVSERVRVITTLWDGECAPVAVDDVLAEPLALAEREALTVAVSEVVPDVVVDIVDVFDIERESDNVQLDDGEVEAVIEDGINVPLGEVLREVLCDTDSDTERAAERDDVAVGTDVRDTAAEREDVLALVSVADALSLSVTVADGVPDVVSEVVGNQEADTLSLPVSHSTSRRHPTYTLLHLGLHRPPCSPHQWHDGAPRHTSSRQIRPAHDAAHRSRASSPRATQYATPPHHWHCAWIDCTWQIAGRSAAIVRHAVWHALPSGPQ